MARNDRPELRDELSARWRTRAVGWLAWPVALVLVVSAIITVTGAAYQHRSVSKQLREHDQEVVQLAAARVERILQFQSQDVKTFVERQLFEEDGSGSSVNSLQDTVASDSLILSLTEARLRVGAPSWLRGVVVTDSNGRILRESYIEEVEKPAGTVRDELRTTIKRSIASGSMTVSDRVESAGRPIWFQATPLAGSGIQLGVWVEVIDAGGSQVGAAFEHGTGNEASGVASHPIILDSQGVVIAGADAGGYDSAGSKDELSTGINGTKWNVKLEERRPPTGVPSIVFYMLIIGMIVLVVLYRYQEKKRSDLELKSFERSMQIEALYSLAWEMLREQRSGAVGERVVHATREMLNVDAVRLTLNFRGRQLISGDGDIPREHRSVRMAIVSHGESLGEMAVYRKGSTSLNSEERALIQTICALTGAAFNAVKVLERERATATELKRVDELRTNLLSTVAHELRSPLTAVKGLLGLMLMQSDLSDKQREYAELAEARTNALVTLISDLFDCSLLESGELDINPKRVNACEILYRALGAHEASSAGSLKLNAPQDLYITVDPIRFDQICNNLVSNAMRHGKPPVTVEVRPVIKGVELVVTDSGEGISSGEATRIFDKFYQSSAGHSRSREGAGIGLSLVKGLVELHGGTITVDNARDASGKGSGARFTILFPDVVGVNAKSSGSQAGAA